MAEKAHSAHTGDLESQNLNLMDSEAGASLRRQISVQLTAEQFERLYLQPGGAKAKGDLAKVSSYAPLHCISTTQIFFCALTLALLLRSVSVTLLRSESPRSCCA